MAAEGTPTGGGRVGLCHARIGYAPAVTSLAERLIVARDVADALAGGGPVVALESTLISHGLPYPQNVEVARAAEAAVRASGAVPATVAVRDGRILVGLTDDALATLATAPTGSVRKVSRPSLAVALAAGGWAATTVSATMIAAHAAGIAVFATGGIGGVHRAVVGGGSGRPGGLGGLIGGAGRAPDGPGGPIGDARPTFDISADLEELARTPVAVVCAGPKAILDVPATLEYLETRGVPVVAIGQAELPGFFSRGSGVPAPAWVEEEAAAADVVRTHFGLGLGSGLLLCTPVPADAALSEADARAAIERAIADADQAGIAGPALTPWLLARIAELTGGASIRANTALIVHDAEVAGRLAAALAGPVYER
jgi:pseudouridine-5'-phosphate glycosidase